jgi:hypothetical protein
MNMLTSTTRAFEPVSGMKAGLQRLRRRVATSRRPHELFVHGASDAPSELSEALDAFAQWAAENAGAVCAVGLSSRWLLNSVAPADMGAEAAAQQALQQWVHYMDMDEAALQSEWVLRRAASVQVHLLTAAPRTLIDGLGERADQHGIRLEWVGPWWARGVQTWLAALQDQVQPDTSHVLHLLEPGLVTHVQAEREGEGAGRLTRVWVEGGMAEAPASPGATISLPEPDRQFTAALPYHQHVWDHPLVMPVLQGQSSCWQVAA